MLKNLSFLALAGALTFTSACILVTDDGGDDAEAGDGDGDNETSTTGDGDGDPGDGDGDPTTGDGDGDPTTGDGDGDGDPTTGDGDGDTPVGMCGWNSEAMYYECGFEGTDPSGTFPIECPAGLVEGEPCETSGLTGEGCCDADGNNWYCTSMGDVVVFDACGA